MPQKWAWIEYKARLEHLLMRLRLLQEWAERKTGPVWCITLKTTILGLFGSIGSAAEHHALPDIKSTGVAKSKKKKRKKKS